MSSQTGINWSQSQTETDLLFEEKRLPYKVIWASSIL